MAEPFAMERIAYKYPFYYYRDIATDIVYVRASNGDVTAMLDPENGLPLTYTRYMELYNQISADSE